MKFESVCHLHRRSNGLTAAKGADALPSFLAYAAGAFFLIVVIVFAARHYNAKIKIETGKIIRLALDNGYQEHNLTPLLYAFSPFSETFKAGKSGSPILAWDEDRIELFVQLPGTTAPQSLRSGSRGHATISPQLIATGNPFWGKSVHPMWGEQWGLYIDFRRVEPDGAATTLTWKFVPFTRDNRQMRKAAVAELVATMENKVTV